MGGTRAIIERVFFSILGGLIVTGIKNVIAGFIALPGLYIVADKTVILGPPHASFVLTVVATYTLLSSVITGFVIWNRDLGKICKDLRFMSHVSEFASNGFASFQYVDRGNVHCMKISLQNHGSKEKSEAFTTFGDCGIIFYKALRRFHMFRAQIPLTRGLRVSDKRRLKLEIMGAEGGEKIGFGMKDMEGHEQKREFERFLPEGIKKMVWQEVDIDIESEFVLVTRGMNVDSGKYLENFSIFTNDNLAGNKKIVIYVRNIRFEE